MQFHANNKHIFLKQLNLILFALINTYHNSPNYFVRKININALETVICYCLYITFLNPDVKGYIF